MQCLRRGSWAGRHVRRRVDRCATSQTATETTSLGNFPVNPAGPSDDSLRIPVIIGRRHLVDRPTKKRPEDCLARITTGTRVLTDGKTGAYDTPRISTTFGSRSFSYAAPHAWNQLPADIRLISTVSTFKQHLKTHLFNIAYFY